MAESSAKAALTISTNNLIGKETKIYLDGRTNQKIGLKMEILKDARKSLTIHDVSGPDFNDRFRSADAEVPNFGYTDAAIWTRFTIVNPSDTPKTKHLAYEFPLADHVSFFIPAKTGFNRFNAGHSLPESKSMIPNRYYVCPLHIGSKEAVTCYVRLATKTNMIIPLSIWEPGALEHQDRQNLMFFGVICGILAAFILYFSTMAVKLKSGAAMWFAFYIACMGLLLAAYQGRLQQLLSPALTDLNKLILIVIIGCLYFSGAKFFRIFLELHRYSPLSDRLLQGLQWMGIGFIPINIFPNTFTPLYGIILVGIGPLFSTGLSIVLWIRGIPNAKYFAIGWIIGHTASEIDLLISLAAIPYFAGAVYLIPAAAISSILFFSIAMIEQNRENRNLATKDGLTGLANRRSFDQALAIEWNRQMRSKQPLSLVLADIDEFKGYNDAYGHAQGDECLKAVAGVFAKNTRRSGDLAPRYGGEEFVVLLPQSDGQQASRVAEKIRVEVQNLSIAHKTSRTAQVVTISAGTFTTTPSEHSRLTDFFEQADRGLYLAKNTGRNRVVSIPAMYSVSVNSRQKALQG
jgi:diguanylate cyclase (GGDEF)-like protein